MSDELTELQIDAGVAALMECGFELEHGDGRYDVKCIYQAMVKAAAPSSVREGDPFALDNAAEVVREHLMMASRSGIGPDEADVREALVKALPIFSKASPPVREGGDGSDVDELLRRVVARLGIAGVLDLSTSGSGNGTIDVRWRRDYADAGLSDERIESHSTVADALRAVLDYENEADELDAEEAPDAAA